MRVILQNSLYSTRPQPSGSIRNRTHVSGCTLAASCIGILFMKASLSLIKLCSPGSRKLFLWRKKTTLRPFSSWYLSFSSNDSVSVSNNPNCNSSNCFVEQYHIDDTHHLRRVKSILESRGWNFSSQNSWYGINLHVFDIDRILGFLFSESLDASLAFYFFRWSEWYLGFDHDVRTVWTMIHILISGNMNYRAVDLVLCLVRKNGGDDWWLDNLIRSFHETQFSERKTLGTAYSMLVHCYVQENMSKAGLKLALKMKNFDLFPSAGVCNLLIRALLQSGELELAWDFLEEIQSCGGLSFNVSFISLFIHEYFSQGDIFSGCKLLMEMKNYGMSPDVVAYTMLINSLCKMSLLRDATCILFKMTQMGMPVDSVCVSSVIDGFCRVGKIEMAIDILKIFRTSPNIYIYNSFISNLCTEGDMFAASHSFHEMLELGLSPDCFSHTTIIAGYCKIRDLNAAQNFLGKMLKRGIKPSVCTYTVLIDGYCKSGDLDTAENYFKNMITSSLVPDLVAYNILMDGYGKKGLLHKVFWLLDMIKSHGMSPNIVTYNTVVHSLIVRGFVNEAKEVLDELIRRGFSPDVVTFTDVVSGYSNKGNFEEAFLVWFYMSEHRIKPDVVTCTALLNGYCRARRMAEASALFNEMINVGLVPDLMLYNTLIHGFCSVGNMDEACRLVELMAKHGINPNDVTYRALILGYEKIYIKNPAEAAAFKLQQILQIYDMGIGDYQLPSLSFCEAV